MNENDFLSQFSGQKSNSKEEPKIQPEVKKKPDSFSNEVRTKIIKPKKQISTPLLIGILATLVVIAFVVYLIFFAPKIDMPDFVGKTKNDVAAWVKQQEIEPSGIIFNDDYYFDYDEGTIVEQSIEPNKKVSNKVKLTFVSSLGADPEELIKVPDLMSMDKTEIKNWIDSNKLTKTKITTVYDEVVELDKVISIDYSGTDSDNFKRSSTLKIVVSKGPQPAGTVTVEDFVKKDYSLAESWCTTKKLTFVKTEAFSETIASGLVISQSLSSGQIIKEGESFTVVVSKGKGIKVPDLTKMTKDAAKKWIKDNGVVTTDKYSNESSYVLSQSIKANTYASETEIKEMEVVVSLGNWFYLEDFTGGEDVVGMYINKLEDLCNQNRSKGIDAFVGNWSSDNEVYSEEYYRGQIVSVKYSSHSTGKEYGENDRMPLDLRFNAIVSKGIKIKLELTKVRDSASSSTGEDYINTTQHYLTSELVDYLASKNIPFKNNCTSPDGQCRLYVEGFGDITNYRYGDIYYYEGDRVRLENYN